VSRRAGLSGYTHSALRLQSASDWVGLGTTRSFAIGSATRPGNLQHRLAFGKRRHHQPMVTRHLWILRSLKFDTCLLRHPPLLRSGSHDPRVARATLHRRYAQCEECRHGDAQNLLWPTGSSTMDDGLVRAPRSCCVSVSGSLQLPTSPRFSVNFIHQDYIVIR
jgi:hypothetical protein